MPRKYVVEIIDIAVMIGGTVLLSWLGGIASRWSAVASAAAGIRSAGTKITVDGNIMQEIKEENENQDHVVCFASRHLGDLFPCLGRSATGRDGYYLHVSGRVWHASSVHPLTL